MIDAIDLARRCEELERELDLERRRSALGYAALLTRIAELTRQLGHQRRQDETTLMRVRVLEASALRDELTGLFNRRGFYAVGEHLLATTPPLPGAVFFVDIDRLEEINDRHGQAAGDGALQRAADILTSCFRDTDAVARLGGDEFAALALAVAGHEVAEITARLEAALAGANQRRGDAPALAWSVGIIPFEAGSTRNLDALVLDADRRMYLAKRESITRRTSSPMPGR
jgi:diguanylate cyclase (GGDEF)-like protein